MNLPPITQQAILYVDGTPDSDYVLRILRAYRENCNCVWAICSNGNPVETDPLLKLMNEHCEKRAKLLDKAIAILEEAQEDK